MSFHRQACLALSCALLPLSVLAEPPMQVDDASTLDKGGMKIEGAFRRDGQERGGELLYGFAPSEGVEIAIATSDASDRAEDAAAKMRGASFGLKWAPLRNEMGWSLGMSLTVARTRVDDRANEARRTEENHAITGLATYRFQDGQKFHANFGVVRVEARDERETLGAWGLGYEYPLAEKLQLTAEVFGQEKGRPDKALGLRFAVAEDLKIAAAFGQGNGRRFGQIGFAWEF